MLISKSIFTDYLFTANKNKDKRKFSPSFPYFVHEQDFGAVEFVPIQFLLEFAKFYYEKVQGQTCKRLHHIKVIDLYINGIDCVVLIRIILSIDMFICERVSVVCIPREVRTDADIRKVVC